eukprot:COSAG01_NODE_8823_length_2648_cov_3.571989_3_plen_67_part_00
MDPTRALSYNNETVFNVVRPLDALLACAFDYAISGSPNFVLCFRRHGISYPLEVPLVVLAINYPLF